MNVLRRLEARGQITDDRGQMLTSYNNENTCLNLELPVFVDDNIFS
jgi:hypothetical protein